MKLPPIEIAHAELSRLLKDLGPRGDWESLNYHAESGLCWLSNYTLTRILYLDPVKYGPIVEVLNEVGDLEEHMSVSVKPV